MRETCDHPACDSTDIYLRVGYEGWPVTYVYCKEHSPVIFFAGQGLDGVR